MKQVYIYIVWYKFPFSTGQGYFSPFADKFLAVGLANLPTIVP